MSHDRALGDNELVDLLREALQVLPEDRDTDTAPPDAVIEGAKWAHEWLNMDAELAELTFDSTEDLELAGVRSASSLRELTFVSGRHTVDMAIEPGPRTAAISGTVDPPVTGTVQVMIGGEIFADDLDSTGSFSIQHVAYGTVLAFITTPSGTIRLGSFEL